MKAQQTDFTNIFAGWFIDGSGEPARRNIWIKIKNNMIAELREVGDARPDMGNGIDLSDFTLIPGLLDSHVHLFMSGTADPELRRQQLDAPFEKIKEVISRHIRRQLRHGVVAVRDGGDRAGHVLRFKKEWPSSEKLPVHINSAGRAWHSLGRYGSLIGRTPSIHRSLAQEIGMCRDKIDHVKIVNSGINSLTQFAKQTAPQFTAEQLTDAVNAAKGLGLKVMVHANGEVPVRLAIEAGCHSIEHGFFMGLDNLKKMADKQLYWVPTVFTMKAYHDSPNTNALEKDGSLRNFDHQMEQIAKAIQYGVPIAVGTDSGSTGVHHGEAIREEIRLLMQAGMNLETAIQSATLTGSRVMGMEQDFGRLDRNMPATFVAFKGPAPSLSDALDMPDEVFIRGRRLTDLNITC